MGTGRPLRRRQRRRQPASIGRDADRRRHRPHRLRPLVHRAVRLHPSLRQRLARRPPQHHRPSLPRPELRGRRRAWVRALFLPRHAQRRHRRRLRARGLSRLPRRWSPSRLRNGQQGRAPQRRRGRLIDGSDVVIERCRFRNTTRQGDGTLGNGDPHKPLTGLGQPGSIDIEPNADDFAIIRDIVVRGNHFTGGGGYAVSMLLLPNKDVRVPISGITIEGNVIENRYGGFDAFGFRGDGAMQSDRGYAITVRDNTVRGCEKPFIANGMRGLTITGNRFVDCTGHAELGYDSALANVTLSNNLFERVGGPQGNALWVRGGADVAITGNRFVDAGAAGRRDGISVAFVTGAMRRYAFSGNIFTSPTGRTAQPVLLFQDAKLDRGTLRLGDNRQPAATIPIPRLLGM
ncbi:MAG: hypothetical protein EOP68_03950 [Sphingomonas sp.]|nr:MAG: hypothetical protein EOP68_03950 [Sphingomonas sp.]